VVVIECLRFLGNLSFLLEINGTTCVINPSKKSNFTLRDVRRCDLVFITSEEDDCFDPELIKLINERTYASVVAPKHILSRIDISDKFKVDIKTNDRFSLKGLDIQATKSAHPQSSYPVGYLVSSAKWRIYYSGSTYAFTDMNKISCDVAILPIAGTYCMDAFAAASACRDLRPKYAIPIAYDVGQANLSARVSEFANDLPKTTKPIILKPGSAAKLKK